MSMFILHCPDAIDTQLISPMSYVSTTRLVWSLVRTSRCQSLQIAIIFFDAWFCSESQRSIHFSFDPGEKYKASVIQFARRQINMKYDILNGVSPLSQYGDASSVCTHSFCVYIVHVALRYYNYPLLACLQLFCTPSHPLNKTNKGGGCAPLR